MVKWCCLEQNFWFIQQPNWTLFTEVITTFNAIIDNEKIYVNKDSRVLGYIESLLKSETAFTAQAYLQIFSCTTPLSKNLQTLQLDLLSVHCMAGQLVDNMQKKRDDFQTRAYARGVGVTPPWAWYFTKTLFPAQRGLIDFAYFLLVNMST